MIKVLIVFLSLSAYHHSFAFDRNEVEQALWYAVHIVPPTFYHGQVQTFLNQCANDMAVYIEREVPAIIGFTPDSASIVGNFREEVFKLANDDLSAIRYEPNTDTDYIQQQCGVFQGLGYIVVQTCQNSVANGQSSDLPAVIDAAESATEVAYGEPVQVEGWIQPMA